MANSAEILQVLSLTPGRMRLHLPGWTAGAACQIETRLSGVAGVKNVQVNPLTRNLLILFDGSTTGEELLEKLQEAELVERQRVQPAGDGIHNPAGEVGRSRSFLLRVGVRGLLGHAVVDSLWFGAGFFGSALGLPLAGLGPLHVLMDIAVWGFALGSSVTSSSSPPGEDKARAVGPAH